jgi:hypothetical protein
MNDEQRRWIYGKNGPNVLAAIRGTGIIHTNKRYDTSTDTLSSVLCDLLHYAAREGKSFDEALTHARQQFTSDSGVVN